MTKQLTAIKADTALGVLKTILVPLIEGADPDAGLAQVRALVELAQATVEYAGMKLWEVEDDCKV